MWRYFTTRESTKTEHTKRLLDHHHQHKIKIEINGVLLWGNFFLNIK